MKARAPDYVSAVGGSDVADGWRERAATGVAIEMASGCHAICARRPLTVIDQNQRRLSGPLGGAARKGPPDRDPQCGQRGRLQAAIKGTIGLASKPRSKSSCDSKGLTI